MQSNYALSAVLCIKFIAKQMCYCTHTFRTKMTEAVWFSSAKAIFYFFLFFFRFSKLMLLQNVTGNRKWWKFKVLWISIIFSAIVVSSEFYGFRWSCSEGQPQPLGFVFDSLAMDATAKNCLSTAEWKQPLIAVCYNMLSCKIQSSGDEEHYGIVMQQQEAPGWVQYYRAAFCFQPESTLLYSNWIE